MIFPEAMIFISSLSPKPTSISCTKTSPSRSGVPMEFENSTGAAPVPPSPPSTVIKSGVIPVFSMALQISTNSSFFPTHSLNPTGFPPESSLSFRIKYIISSAFEKAECDGGDSTSVCGLIWRIAAISSVFFTAGSTPPCPGFAPCESLISIIFISSLSAIF